MQIPIRSRIKGFLLVSTIWFLVIISIAVSFFALWTQNTLTLATELQEDIQGEIDIASTQATLLYLFASQPYTYRGLDVPPLDVPTEDEDDHKDDEQKTSFDNLWDDNSVLPTGREILLDNQVYHGIGNVFFSIQDEAGLLSLNFLSDFLFLRFLNLLGVDSADAGPLMDKLRDYTDLDDFHRLNGAERYHYEQAKQAPPPNRLLNSPLQAKAVLGWQEHPQLWQNGDWGQLTTIAPTGWPNFNTAPSLVLQAAYGFNPTGAERLINIRRTEKPMMDSQDIVLAAGMMPLTIQEMDMIFFPSLYLRITLWHQKTHYMKQYHITLTPFESDQAPWRTEYSFELPLSNAYQSPSAQTVKTPLFSAALSTNTP